MGTFGGALEARGVDASSGKLTAEVTGEIVKEEKVLVIRRIRVAYRLEAAEADRGTIERVHGFHARFCPVARSISPAIEISTSVELA